VLSDLVLAFGRCQGATEWLRRRLRVAIATEVVVWEGWVGRMVGPVGHHVSIVIAVYRPRLNAHCSARQNKSHTGSSVLPPNTRSIVACTLPLFRCKSHIMSRRLNCGNIPLTWSTCAGVNLNPLVRDVDADEPDDDGDEPVEAKK